MNVWISPAGVLLEFPHSQVLYLRTYLVCSDSSTLVPAASLAIITLRSSWPWGLDILLAQPQATELVPAYTGKVVVYQYSNGKAYNPPQAVFHVCRRLHQPSQPSGSPAVL
jgi:hypothetical protein